MSKRRAVQWVLLWIVIITLSLGWKYPLLGFSVPLVMVAGFVGSLINGRYVCGNLCPRGSFFDRIMSKISLNRRVPPLFRNKSFRMLIFAGLMGFMGYRLLGEEFSIYRWGHIFWLMCVITTAVGVILALIWQARGWCYFCPMGTMQNFIGGGKNQLKIESEACVECNLCQKNCPFALDVCSFKDKGYLPDRDCLKCSQCIAACPEDALKWPEK